VCCPTRRRSSAEEDSERAEVTNHIENVIMEPAKFSWTAVNVFVPKKSGSLRTTTDFRLLNEMTVSDMYPMEDVRTILDWLSSKRIFSTFDIKDGFFQVNLAEESRPLTAFRTVMGLMQYMRLPQGLKNSPATFQRIMNTVLGDLKGNSVSNFVNDISVGTKTVK
jgi:Reverse transcriptase (RNA-dependent DNA polymerase)